MLCRCKVGDLAIVIREHPGCEINLGKVVIIHRAGYPHEEEGPQWVVTPARPQPWWFIELDGSIVSCYVTPEDCIVHPDAYLWPIRPEEASAETLIVTLPVPVTA